MTIHKWWCKSCGDRIEKYSGGYCEKEECRSIANARVGVDKTEWPPVPPADPDALPLYATSPSYVRLQRDELRKLRAENEELKRRMAMQQVPPKESKLLPWSIAAESPIDAFGTLVMDRQPDVAVRPRFFVIDPASAPLFDLVDFLVGNYSVMPSRDPIPCSCLLQMNQLDFERIDSDRFAELAKPFALNMPVVDVSMRVRIMVRNHAPYPAEFRSVLYVTYPLA